MFFRGRCVQLLMCVLLLPAAVSSLAARATTPVRRSSAALAGGFSRKKPVVTPEPILGEGPSAIFFTLNKTEDTLKLIDGPIRHDGAYADDTAYVTEIFRIILAEADRQGGFYLNQDHNPGAYLAFLVGSIAVPFNESKFQQFRKPVRNGKCDEAMNNGDAVAADAGGGKEGEELRQIFQDELVKQRAADCNEPAVSADIATYTQLMSSFDGQSFGLFQEDYQMAKNFLPSGDYLSVASTAKDGLDLYLAGFKKILGKAPSYYPCLDPGKGASESAESIDWVNMARGAWSGPYNSGNAAEDKVCRFVPAYDKSPIDVRWNKENDIPFGENYQVVLDPDSAFFNYFLRGAELAEFRELITLFLKLGTPELPSVDDAQKAAESLQALIQHPESQPAALLAIAPRITEPEKAPAEIEPKEPPKRVSFISDQGEVITKPSAASVRTLDNGVLPSMYVSGSADLYLMPVLDQTMHVATISTPDFEVSPVKRVDTRNKSGEITNQWYEIEMPDDSGVADQIRERNRERSRDPKVERSRAPIKAGTHFYVQAAQLSSLAGGKVIGHFKVNVAKGTTLNLHLSPRTTDKIRDYAVRGELLEAIGSRVLDGVTWYEIYDRNAGDDLWAISRSANSVYLEEVKPKAAIEDPKEQGAS